MCLCMKHRDERFSYLNFFQLSKYWEWKGIILVIPEAHRPGVGRFGFRLLNSVLIFGRTMVKGPFFKICKNICDASRLLFTVCGHQTGNHDITVLVDVPAKYLEKSLENQFSVKEHEAFGGLHGTLPQYHL